LLRGHKLVKFDDRLLLANLLSFTEKDRLKAAAWP
jgi:hypothetical protein